MAPQAGASSTGSPTQTPTQSTDPVIRLLLCLREGELSSADTREAVGIKHRPTFRANYMHPAPERGLIEPTIPDKPTSRLQKYRITPQGRALLEADAQSPASADEEQRDEADRARRPPVS